MSRKSLPSQSYGELLCHGFRAHRWRPTSAHVGKLIAGMRTRNWLLSCEGCDSTATEWRFVGGGRIPGTQRQYNLTPSYRELIAHGRDESLEELAARMEAAEAEPEVPSIAGKRRRKAST